MLLPLGDSAIRNGTSRRYGRRPTDGPTRSAQPVGHVRHVQHEALAVDGEHLVAVRALVAQPGAVLVELDGPRERDLHVTLIRSE